MTNTDNTITTDHSFTLADHVLHSRTITFHNEKNEVIGTLFFEGDQLDFEGNASESAKVFFDCVLKYFNRPQ